MLRLKYIYFIAIIIVTLVATQIVVHSYIWQQKGDASLINVSGRQRMLSQRITKLALLIEKNNREGRVIKDKLDTLRANTIAWKNAHHKLSEQNNFNSKGIDSLMNIQAKLINNTIAACNLILENPNQETIQKAVAVIEANDTPFLINMEKIVAEFQSETEANLKMVESIGYYLAVFSGLIILTGFSFLMVPAFRTLRKKNNDLTNLNEELLMQDEKLKASFDQIMFLQTNLKIKERQYRERVEEAVDAIYEADIRGLFTYVNPSAQTLTGYSRPSLLKMHYYDLIVEEDYKKEVITFYEKQLKSKIDTTYKEFPIVSKSGEVVWVGQTLRMVFEQGQLKNIYAVARNITNVFKSRNDLQVSEQRFKALSEHSPIGIHELNSNGEVIYTNKQWSEISGVSEKTSTSKERIKMIHPDDREKTMQAWTAAIKERREVSVEFRLNNPKKGIVWVISHTSPVFDEHGELRGYIGTSSDITELKETYLKLVETAETYKLISTNSKDLITLYKNNAEATRIFVSPSVKNILGYEPEELIGKSPFDIILPEDVKRIKETVHVDTLHGKPGYNEYRIRKKDGSVIWMEANAHPYFNEHNEMIGFQTSAREITFRKEMEQKLAERERLYRLLSEHTQDLIALHTPDGTYTFVSSSFNAILGYNPDDLLGKSAYSIIHEDDHERLRNGAHKQILEGNTSFNVEYRIRKKNGEHLWVEAYTKPIADEHGNIISIQTSSRDISQRKAFEIALTDAKTKAEEANKAKSQFLSMMSHEIRTPMNAVIGITSFLIDENPSSKQLENLKLLKYSGENLLTIINDILDFSKIEAGKMDLEETSFDLHEMLQNIISMMQHRAKEKDLELLLIHDTTLPKYVIGDSARINQVLINLLGNAIKFTESGRVELEIQTKPLTANSYDLLFSITDTGIGIEHDKIEMIFESFSQANKDTARKFGGTGLGLAITKKLVNLMGADIGIISELGAGSKFYFTLKLKSGETKKASQPYLTTINNTANQIFNILIVEDNRVNQIVVSNYLKKWGLQFTYANDGHEALDKIASKSYNLILMDIQMPGMNGYEATKIIRSYEDPYFKNIPIIALTASVLVDKKTEILDIGFNDFVTKPFNPEELNGKIFSYLKELAVIK